MSETLLWSDDFNYASHAALEAAYPYTYNSGVTGMPSSIHLVTPGPDGYATGIDSKGVSADYGPLFDVNQWMIAPTSRCFHFRGVWQIDTVDSVNAGQSLVNMAWVADDGSYFFGQYWQLSVRKSDFTELNLTVKGGDGTSGSYPTAAYTSGYVPGLLTYDAANEIDVAGYISSLTETSPGSGVYSANADGSVTVKVNGATVLSWSGVVWNWKDDVATPKWNEFEIHPSGTFSGLRVWECGTASVVDNADDICCSTGDGGNTVPTGGGQGNGAQPVMYPAIGSQIECAGGGLVPTQADLTFSETWWHA